MFFQPFPDAPPAQVVTAQVAPAGVETYPAAFFVPFAPQTALDMARRVPGFRLDLGDEGVRGLGEAGGNVLVDGRPPAAKTGGLAAVLAAIPAGQVVRIEILRGGAAGGDPLGRGVVANIVRAPRPAGLSAEARATLADGDWLGGAVLTLSRSAAGLDLSATTTLDMTGERSHGERVQADLAGARAGRQALDYRTDYPELSQRLAIDGALAGGRLKASATLAGARLSEAFAFAEPGAASRFPKDTRRWRGELGGDWSRTVGEGRALKLAGLARFTDLDARSDSLLGPAPQALAVADRFESRSRSREAVLRASLAGEGAWRPQVGLEAAWNDLDSDAVTTLFGARPGRSARAVVVSELRGEAFASLDGRLSPRWTVSLGAAYEASSVRARAEGLDRRAFGFLKPRLVLAWKPDARADLRLSLRRNVGQLSFGDFAASANLAEGTAASGNTRLGPDHRITVDLTYERRFGARGAFTLSAAHDWRGDVLEDAVLPSGDFGLVNVDKARAWRLSADIDLPVDAVLSGGLVKLGYVRRGSDLRDPVTGERRRLDDEQPATLTASLRQDLPGARLSWGIDYADGYRLRSYYANEVRLQRHAADLGAFFETTRLAGTRLRLRVDGLTGARNTFVRRLHAGSRAGPAASRETWDIHTPATVTLSASRAF
ncbi:hypothetical protein DDF62_05895 [Caulobacter radicis]|uniref:TonB-dependent receptor plug domain-containing protein n=1 Tax=Caulobacter radicis TaxID=2172650 RepID=UPI000D581F00|nr:TonB-dependent receptor [Caulobacter radicis]PVM91563.1 hypothetical protein DDF62_05895 [Caulobacter radicis]